MGQKRYDDEAEPLDAAAPFNGPVPVAPAAGAGRHHAFTPKRRRKVLN